MYIEPVRFRLSPVTQLLICVVIIKIAKRNFDRIVYKVRSRVRGALIVL